MDLKQLFLHPDIAKNITLNIKGIDLIRFAERLIDDTNKVAEKHLKSQPEPEKYLTRKDVAELLKVSLVTLYNWNKKGILKTTRIGNKVRYTRSSIDEALGQKEVGI